MSKRLIRKDNHGPYVKFNSSIFRPYFPVGYGHVYDDGTDLKIDEKQNVNRKGPKLAKVGDETWFNHGWFGDNKENTEECWKIKNRREPTKEEKRMIEKKLGVTSVKKINL